MMGQNFNITFKKTNIKNYATKIALFCSFFLHFYYLLLSLQTLGQCFKYA